MIREFIGQRFYSKETYQTPTLSIREIRRAIYAPDAKPLRAYYWGRYKLHTDRWIPTGICPACQPMWTIRFEDGHEMPAYPDEIIPIVMHSSGCPLNLLPLEFRERLEVDKQQTSETASTDAVLSMYDEGHRLDLYMEEPSPENRDAAHEIIFTANEKRFYCFVHGASSVLEALGMFMKHHPHITYDMVDEHEEV